MLFCSLSYLWFFAAIFSLYWLLPWPRARVWLLLAASFYFYAVWNKWLAALICLTTTGDYLLARAMDSAALLRWRKVLLVVSIVGNVGMLCYFKYADFFLHSLAEALRAFGAHASLPVLSVILPVGISFYTFEAINYMVDVYERRIPAEKSLANLGLFILFFPHLVAGPIVRARDFLPQIGRRKRWSWLRLQAGAQLFLLGLFKKLAIADRMAQFVDPVFADPGAYDTGASWMAMIAYAIQVYCDFSGYSDMALGSAQLLGYKLAQNFNLPFLARNLPEFWRRWHMTLSLWLRDYLFFPLGGSRGAGWRVAWNLLVTFTICGLWHGAAWNFVLWGFVTGCLLCLHRAWQGWCRQRPRLDQALQSPAGTILSIACTFLCFCLTLVVFRCSSLAGMGMIFANLFTRHAGLSSPLHPTGFVLACLLMVLGHAAALIGADRWFSTRLPGPVVGAGYATALACTLLLAVDGNQAFIYFQF